MSNFVFMLTQDDETVPDALDLAAQVSDSSVEFIGFKDVGVEPAMLTRLTRAIQASGKKAVLEVVSLTEDDELRSASMAIDLGVDYLVGGTRWRPVGELVAGHGIAYFPYVGRVYEHPAKLAGSYAELVEQTRQLEALVDGINLLAYRHASLPGETVLSRVVAACKLPVLCAGSVNSLDRVRQVAQTGAWGFTIGSAILNNGILPSASVAEQVSAVIAAADGSQP